MSASLTSLAYLVAAVLFILALRGLSSPVTSRSGNRFGMIGMAVAIVATLLHHGMGVGGFGLIALGLLLGCGIGGGGTQCAGSVRHRRAGRDPYAKPGRNVVGIGYRSDHVLRLPDRLRQVAGVDEGRADYLSGSALSEPGTGDFAGDPGAGVRADGRSSGVVLADRAAVAGARVPDHHPDRRRRYAGGGFYVELLFRVGRRRDRVHHSEPGVDHHGVSGWRV